MTLSFVRTPSSRRAALGLALAAALTAGCGSDLVGTETAPRLQLQGIVRRADDGKPIAGALVGLRRLEQRDGYQQLAVAAETTTDAQGRYTLSYVTAPGECPALTAAATIEDWYTSRYTPVPSRSVRCTSGAQRIDVKLIFERI